MAKAIQRRRARHRGNACVLESGVRLPAFQHHGRDMFEGLQDLLGRMDTSPSLRVVVFESANPDFYLAHFEVKDKTGNLTRPSGPPASHPAGYVRSSHQVSGCQHREDPRLRPRR